MHRRTMGMSKRSKKKLSILLFICSTMLSVCTVQKIPSHAEEGDLICHWELVDQKVLYSGRDRTTGWMDWDYGVKRGILGISGLEMSTNSFHTSELLQTGDDGPLDLDTREHEYVIYDWASVDVTWNAPPERIDVIEGNPYNQKDPSRFEIVFRANFNNTKYNYESFGDSGYKGLGIRVKAYAWGMEPGEVIDADTAYQEWYKMSPVIDLDIDEDYDPHAETTANTQETYTAVFDTGATGGNFASSEERLTAIYINLSTGISEGDAVYIYRYYEDWDDQEEAVTVTGTTEASHTEAPYKETETVHYAESEAGEDAGADIGWDIVEPSKPVVKPQTSSGSGDKKTSLPKAIGVAVGGALAGAGVAGAATGGGGGNGGSSSSESPSQETAEEEKKRYKMFISKDFGDAIKKGAPPVTVRARIMEIGAKGGRKPRPDLTERITVSGEGLQTGSVTMDGMWLTVQVYAEEESTAKEGTVIFIFNGEGGRFRNRVIFRLTGKPYIVFPDTPSYTDGMYLKMIANDPETYSVRFFFEDAAGEPEKLLLSGGDLFRTRVREAENVLTYYADVTAISKTERTSLYTAPEREYIGIHAEFADGDIVDSGFHVEIWPEGLSISSRHVRKDRLMIDTIPNPDAGDLDYTIRPTEFEVKLAYRDSASGKPVFLTGEDLKPRFSDLYQVERYGKTFTDNFRYTINTQFDLYAFEPQDTLPMLKDPYEAMIDIECETGGEVYAQSMPLGFYGEKPLLPVSMEWEEVYKKLKRDIEIFGIGKDPQLSVMLRNAREHSADELRDMRRKVIEAGVAFYMEYGEAYRDYEKLLTKYIVVAGTMVSAGDLAVEYILKYYFVGYGTIVAKFSNPLKNLLCTYLGEYIANGNIDAAPDFIDTVQKGCEEALSTAITGMFWDDDLKGDVDVAVILGNKSLNITKPPVTEQIKDVLGYVIATYLLLRFVYHYNKGKDGEKGDIYRSVRAAFADFSLTMIKAWFLDMVSEKCSAVFGKIGEACGKMYKKTCQNKINELAGKAGDQAYAALVRKAFRNNPDELTKAAYDTAVLARKEAQKAMAKSLNEPLNTGIKELGKAGTIFGEGVKKVADSKTAGQVLNYALGGKEDGTEAIGPDTKEIIYNLIYDWLGVKAGKIYEGGHMGNLLNVTMRIEGGTIILGIFGYCAEIDILENIDAMINLLYDTLFSWLDTLWQGMKNAVGWDEIPDPRESAGPNAEQIGQELEKTKERIQNNQWKFDPNAGKDGSQMRQ